MNNTDIVPGHARLVDRERLRPSRTYRCQHCGFEASVYDGEELRRVFWEHLYEKHGLVLGASR